MMRLGVIAGLVALCLAACRGAGGTGGGDGPAVVVSAPVSSQPWIASSIVNGAKLAVEDANARGGVVVGAKREKLQLQVLDNGGSPANALANARSAVSEHALALLTDGTGAVSVASVTDPAHLPVFICFDGGANLIDPQQLFRMAPADRSWRAGSPTTSRTRAPRWA